MSHTQTPVLIIGAGPAGLAAAIGLGRLGTPCVLAERRPAVGTHPRATGLRVRTMEVLRGWDLEPQLREQSLPTRGDGEFAWATTLAGTELGRLLVSPDAASLAYRRSASPTFNAWCVQDIVEPIMLEALDRYPSVQVRLSTEVDDLTVAGRGATAVLRDTTTGAATPITARYVLACDGAGSGVRSALGIDLQGPEYATEFVNIYFRADLGELLGRSTPTVHYLINSRSSGGLITLDGRHRWLFSAMQPIDQTLDDQWCREVVRAALGVPELPVEIVNAKPWRMTAQVAKTFRSGDVFLVGDAAHRFPPTGGFGMNSSIQDAHNLAWKLHAVLAGWAGPALLDSYQTERQPIAEINSAQSWHNLELMAETGFGPAAYELGAALEAGDTEVRDRIRRGIPLQSVQFDALGQDLGFGYPDGALVPDGSPAPPQQQEFVPNSAPGFRAPHHVLLRAGQEISTLDLVDDGFTVLAGAGGQDWVTGSRLAAAERGIPLRAYRIGPDGDLADPAGSWPELAGVGAAGACLIRPDGHVAWRTASAASEPAAAAIGAVLDQVLDR